MKQTEISDIDSVDSLIQLQEKARQDSINKALEPWSEYAWGDAKFGLSIEEAKKTNALQEYSYSTMENNGSLLSRTFAFSDNSPYKEIDVVFRNQRLYAVVLFLDNIMYKYYNDDISGELRRYKQMIEKKYGAPSISNDIPNKKKIKTNEKSLIYNWVIGDKTIGIYIIEFEKETLIRLLKRNNGNTDSNGFGQKGVPMRSLIYELSRGRDYLGKNGKDDGIYREGEIEILENEYIQKNKVFTLICIIENDNEKRLWNKYNDSINMSTIKKEDDFNLF